MHPVRLLSADMYIKLQEIKINKINYEIQKIKEMFFINKGQYVE